MERGRSAADPAARDAIVTPLVLLTGRPSLLATLSRRND
jgi:hypothetical protein